MDTRTRPKRRRQALTETSTKVNSSSERCEADFNFFRDLPKNVLNQIFDEFLIVKGAVDPAKTKPPPFLYTCRYVWLEAFGFYYGRNHFVLTVDTKSINAVTTYLNTILGKLNNVERHGVVAVQDFTGKAKYSFGSVHLKMQLANQAYEAESLKRLDTLWNRALCFHQYRSMLKFRTNLKRTLEGRRRVPQNSRVQDQGLIKWHTKQEKERLRLEAEERRLCRDVGCRCYLDAPDMRYYTCRREIPSSEGYWSKGLANIWDQRTHKRLGR